MRKQFEESLEYLAAKDPRITLLYGDVEFPNINNFKKLYSGRFLNLGLCEQSMISIAAGMALNGLRPIVYSITPFLIERPFEQLKIDIDENNLPVILVGYDDYPTYGPTHRPLNLEKTIALFKNIQGFYPKTNEEVDKALIDAYLSQRPSMIWLRKIGPAFVPRIITKGDSTNEN